MTQAVVATTVTGLQGRGVANTAPNPGQALAWNGSAWAPAGPYLALAGGTLTGPVVLAGDATVALNPVSLQQLQGGYLPLAGGSISGSLTVNGLITPSNSGIKGSTNSVAAPAGSVGEYVTNSQTNIAIANQTWTSFSAISLTPGWWLCWGMMQFAPTASAVGQAYAGLSTTLNAFANFASQTVTVGSGNFGFTALSAPLVSINVAATTLLYINGWISFGSGSVNCTTNTYAVRYR